MELDIEAQMDEYIKVRDTETNVIWALRKKNAAMILLRTLELAELESEQGDGLDRANLINMTKNVIVTLKENSNRLNGMCHS